MKKVCVRERGGVDETKTRIQNSPSFEARPPLRQSKRTFKAQSDYSLVTSLHCRHTHKENRREKQRERETVKRKKEGNKMLEKKMEQREAPHHPVLMG